MKRRKKCFLFQNVDDINRVSSSNKYQEVNKYEFKNEKPKKYANKYYLKLKEKNKMK